MRSFHFVLAAMVALMAAAYAAFEAGRFPLGVALWALLLVAPGLYFLTAGRRR